MKVLDKPRLYVCAKHFSENMMSYKRLKKTAYPDINLPFELDVGAELEVVSEKELNYRSLLDHMYCKRSEDPEESKSDLNDLIKAIVFNKPEIEISRCNNESSLELPRRPPNNNSKSELDDSLININYTQKIDELKRELKEARVQNVILLKRLKKSDKENQKLKNILTHISTKNIHEEFL